MQSSTTNLPFSNPIDQNTSNPFFDGKESYTPLAICVARIEQTRQNGQNYCQCNLGEKDIIDLKNQGFEVEKQNLWHLIKWKNS